MEWECDGAGMMKELELALPDTRRERTLLDLQGTIDGQESAGRSALPDSGSASRLHGKARAS